MPLESPFWCLSSDTNLIFPQLEMQKLYSKYYIFRTYFSNILVVFLSNNILLYTVGKPVLIPIQWCYSHISTVRNTKVIFKIHHFIVFNSLTFVATQNHHSGSLFLFPNITYQTFGTIGKSKLCVIQRCSKVGGRWSRRKDMRKTKSGQTFHVMVQAP